MEAIRTLQMATVLFALAALGGIAMGWVRFSGHRRVRGRAALSAQSKRAFVGGPAALYLGFRPSIRIR